MGRLSVGHLGFQLHGKILYDATKATKKFHVAYHTKLQLGTVWYYNLLPASLLAQGIREGVVHSSFADQICGKIQQQYTWQKVSTI